MNVLRTVYWAALIRRVLWGGLAISVLLTALLTFRYLSDRQRLEQQAFSSARQQASTSAAAINEVFSGVMRIAAALAGDLSSGALPYEDIRDRLRAEAAARPDIDGLAVTFEAYVYDPDLRLYTAYIFQRPDGTFELQDGATYDYLIPPGDQPGAPQTAWYHDPLTKGALWNEPFLATGAGKVLIEYGIPFTRPDPAGGVPITAGVVSIDYSLKGMSDLMAALDLGATGYGYVIAASGMLLAHPIQERVATTTIMDMAAAADQPAIQAQVQRVLSGESFVAETADSVTGRAAWLFYEPIPATGGALGLVLNKDEFLPDARLTMREEVAITLAGCLSLFFLTALAARMDRGTTRSLWVSAITFAILTGVAILIVWRLHLTLPLGSDIQITDRSSLDRYLQGAGINTTASDRADPTRSLTAASAAYTVPTGVFVQSVDFEDATTVIVNGYVWQRYSQSIPPSVRRGFTLPQLSGGEWVLEEAARYRENGDEVILWQFGVPLKQQSNPDQFPFDSRRIVIRLKPLELDQPVILTPDLDGYALINPVLLPGLDAELTIINWNVIGSAFGYRQLVYNASFGVASRGGVSTALELYFQIDARRNFVGSFIAYVIPGVVAAFLLFAFLLATHKREDDENFISTLNFSAALFFVIIVAHTGLRDNIAAVGITYLEHLYIILYVTIVLIAINSFLVARHPSLWVVRYRDNLLPKLLYWPLLLSALLASTLIVFV